MLSKNGINRAKRERLIERYRASMDDGTFRGLNGESISIGTDGSLLNGQHRLEAVVRHGKPVEMLVVRGVDVSTFSTIDTGGGRAASDVLSILGHQYTKVQAAAIGMLHQYRNGAAGSRTAVAAERIELLSYQYPEVADSAAFVGNIRPRPRGVGQSVAVVAHVLFKELDHAVADRFIVDVFLGADLSRGDPVLAIRSRFIEHSSMWSSQFGRWSALSLYIRAWNFRRRGIKVTKIDAWQGSGGRRGNFPTPV